jgi:two-component system phosphate regulon sensor histidine kinase PhoR
MNHKLRSNLLLGTATASVAMAACAPLVAQALTGGLTTIFEIASAGAGLAVAAVAIVLLARHWKRQQAMIEGFVEELRRTDPRSFGGDIEQLLPKLEGSGPLHDALSNLRQHLVELNGSFQEAQRDRARAEVRYRRATAQSEQFTEILQRISEPVLAIDQYDEVLVANSAAEQLFAIQGESTEKRMLRNLVQCEALVDLLTDTRKRRCNNARMVEVAVNDAAGQPQFFTAKVSPITARRDAAGDAEQGAVAVLRDISDYKAIQRRHAEFVSSVSHEMKTPLSSIKAYVELLADGDAEDEQTREEFLDVINGQADRLQRLIDNLLNLARIEAGVVNVTKEKHSLNEVLQEAYNVVQPSAEQKQIKLVSDLSPLYLGVLIDRDMILQSAINLLSNAVKYTPSGGTVTLRSRVIDGRASFEVQDTGVGLSEEDCGRVFEKFYRVKKDRQMASGTGLGLPLAKHIVEEVHGGQLTVTSVLGQGSTFRATLPRVGHAGGEP